MKPPLGAEFSGVTLVSRSLVWWFKRYQWEGSYKYVKVT